MDFILLVVNTLVTSCEWTLQGKAVPRYAPLTSLHVMTPQSSVLCPRVRLLSSALLRRNQQMSHVTCVISKQRPLELFIRSASLFETCFTVRLFLDVTGLQYDWMFHLHRSGLKRDLLTLKSWYIVPKHARHYMLERSIYANPCAPHRVMLGGQVDVAPSSGHCTINERVDHGPIEIIHLHPRSYDLLLAHRSTIKSLTARSVTPSCATIIYTSGTESRGS